MNTEIIGRIEQVTGHTHDIVYDLVFTNDRIVALIIEHPADIPYKPNVMDFIIGNRSGRRGERIEKIKLAEERRASYMTEPLNKLIAANSRNFEIAFDNIITIEIKKNLLSSRLLITLRRLDSRKATLRFGLPKSAVPMIRELMGKILPAKLK